MAIDGMDHPGSRDGTVATDCVVFVRMQFARRVGLLPAAGARAERATNAAFNARTRLLGRVRDRCPR